MSRLWKHIAFFKEINGSRIIFLAILIILLIAGVALKWSGSVFNASQQNIGQIVSLVDPTMNELNRIGEEIVKLKYGLLEKVTFNENSAGEASSPESGMINPETEKFYGEEPVIQKFEEETASGGYQEWHDQDGMIWNGGELSSDDYDWDQIGW